VLDLFEGDRCPRLLAIDVPKGHVHELLRFSTSALAPRQSGRRDTSHKRNLGLLLAHMVGWKRILFLDDDITVGAPADVTRAAGLLDRYDSVGLSIGGFPDNSVVCHAHRIGQGEQDTFVGGGALAVSVPRTLSFFPEIYNEDWFFLLDKIRLQPVAVTGVALQQEYDPFAHSDRAMYEEFGDVLAEGVFWLLDQHRRVQDATQPFWRWFLEKRGWFIDDVARRIQNEEFDPALRQRILVALAVAQRQRESISAELCAEYLRAWRADRTRWRNVVAALPTGRDPEAVVRSFGLRYTSGGRRRVVVPLSTEQARPGRVPDGKTSGNMPWPDVARADNPPLVAAANPGSRVALAAR
jgi:hypothetical protein